MEVTVQEIRCGIMEEFPPWATVPDRRNEDGSVWAKGSHVGEDIIREVVDFWLEQVVSLVIQTCLAKIETYKKFKPQFEEDPYRLEIVASRIEKNQNYVMSLERRMAQTPVEPERRRA
jgi:hypothetical protein